MIGRRRGAAPSNFKNASNVFETYCPIPSEFVKYTKSHFESHQQDGKTDEAARAEREAWEEESRILGSNQPLVEENKLFAEQALRRVMEGVKGQRITRTEIRRRQISELLDAGLKPARVAAAMDCSADVIYMIIRLKKAGESLAPKPKTGRPRIRTKEFVGKLNALRAANPNISQAAMAKKFGVSSATVERALKDDD